MSDSSSVMGGLWFVQHLVLKELMLLYTFKISKYYLSANGIIRDIKSFVINNDGAFSKWSSTCIQI